ncbi:ATP-binding protein [Actinomadura parmotrematis]|uniref:histidine kinase n=1 Tax=Actinomadura parmotrematis TaxID=2864039 RepID=A0ABS7FQU2_9ACTN|nr:ATP-binding protein [Actinomadura parmotrematis]MBW8482773.1 ATP-binding protein [Actinomadura parmotrematis]
MGWGRRRRPAPDAAAGCPPLLPAPAFAAAPAAAPTGREAALEAALEEFSLRLGLLSESMREDLDGLQQRVEDPALLELVYRLDSAAARSWRLAGDQRVLAGTAPGHLTESLTIADMVAVAIGGIVRHDHVVVTAMCEAAAAPGVGEDAAQLLAALLDNSTTGTRAQVEVAASLVPGGAVRIQIDDYGTGLPPQRLAELTRLLAGPVPALSEATARRTGLPVVHRIAARHGLTVELASRTGQALWHPTGTITTVTLPAHLVSAVAPPGAADAGGPPVRDRRALVAEVPAPPVPAAPAPDAHALTADGLPVRPTAGRRGGRGGAPRTPAVPDADAHAAFAADLDGLPDYDMPAHEMPAREMPGQGPPGAPATAADPRGRPQR